MSAFRVLADAYLPGFDFGTNTFRDEKVASAGDTVFQFFGATYGCISENGVAVTAEPGVGPFFEVARSNLRAVPPGVGESE